MYCQMLGEPKMISLQSLQTCEIVRGDRFGSSGSCAQRVKMSNKSSTGSSWIGDMVAGCSEVTLVDVSGILSLDLADGSIQATGVRTMEGIWSTEEVNNGDEVKAVRFSYSTTWRDEELTYNLQQLFALAVETAPIISIPWEQADPFLDPYEARFSFLQAIAEKQFEPHQPNFPFLLSFFLVKKMKQGRGRLAGE